MADKSPQVETSPVPSATHTHRNARVDGKADPEGGEVLTEQQKERMERLRQYCISCALLGALAAILGALFSKYLERPCDDQECPEKLLIPLIRHTLVSSVLLMLISQTMLNAIDWWLSKGSALIPEASLVRFMHALFSGSWLGYCQIWSCLSTLRDIHHSERSLVDEGPGTLVLLFGGFLLALVSLMALPLHRWVLVQLWPRDFFRNHANGWRSPLVGALSVVAITIVGITAICSLHADIGGVFSTIAIAPVAVYGIFKPNE